MENAPIDQRDQPLYQAGCHKTAEVLPAETNIHTPNDPFIQTSKEPFGIFSELLFYY